MSSIKVHSHKRTECYSIIPNHIIDADYLPLDSKMLLIWVLSKKRTWQLNQKSLATIHNTGQSKIKRMVKDLQDSDHLIIKRLGNGQAVWHFFEDRVDCLRKESYPQVDYQPEAIDPQVDNPHEDNPHEDNQPALVSTDLLVSTDPIVKDEKPRFAPPTTEEIYSYMIEKGLNNHDEAESFFDFYQSKGWLVGKVKMKDWKAAVRNWLRRNKKDQPQQAAHKPRMFGEA